jgi:hypothetical protein
MSTFNQPVQPEQSKQSGVFRINRARLPHTLFQVGMCILIFTFLYFTWVGHLQQMIIENQINRVFADLNRDLRLIDLYNTIRPRMIIELKNTLAQNRGTIKARDEQIKASNRSVTIEVWIVVSLLFLGCMFGTYVFAKRQGASWNEILIEGCTVAVSLSVVLILFLYLVVENYDLIDPNVVKKTLVDALIEYGKL